ncbi:hypothetical protein L3X38_043630 [Prunus dulcis]|uniref:MATE efflux family protein n=1 Tax=Prunus dulcis TaxID=3755 RepID=A0AAD4YMN6_PRUDU|nr:hypothetical protein L3X38_043630 [Prunus dulcis]
MNLDWDVQEQLSTLCVTVLESLAIGMVCMIVVLITKDYFSAIFTSKELQQAAAKLSLFLLGITMVLNSVLLEVDGKDWWLRSTWVVGYYIFGLPLGFLLGYKANLGVKGIWGGMKCGTALQTLLLLIVLHRTLWNKEVEQSSE